MISPARRRACSYASSNGARPRRHASSAAMIATASPNDAISCETIVASP
jgi:hypothetical protein